MDRGQWANVVWMPGMEGHPRVFNDHRESGPRFNVSSERLCFLKA